MLLVARCNNAPTGEIQLKYTECKKLQYFVQIFYNNVVFYSCYMTPFIEKRPLFYPSGAILIALWQLYLHIVTVYGHRTSL